MSRRRPRRREYRGRGTVLGGVDLVGRDAELAVVAHALDDVRGGTGRVLGVLGEAGIGKTALLAALGERRARAGLLVLEGRGAEHERDVPFGVVVDALDEHVATLSPRRVADARRRISASVLPAAAAGAGAGRGRAGRGRALPPSPRAARAARAAGARAAGRAAARRPALGRRGVARARAAPAAPPAARRVPARLRAAPGRARRAAAGRRARDAGLGAPAARAAPARRRARCSPACPTPRCASASPREAARQPAVPARAGARRGRRRDGAARDAGRRRRGSRWRRSSRGARALIAGRRGRRRPVRPGAGRGRRRAAARRGGARRAGRRRTWSRATGDGRAFAFRHPLVRRAVYDAAPPAWRLGGARARRRRARARAAPRPAPRAYHVARFARAGRRGGDRAAERGRGGGRRHVARDRRALVRRGAAAVPDGDTARRAGCWRRWRWRSPTPAGSTTRRAALVEALELLPDARRRSGSSSSARARSSRCSSAATHEARAAPARRARAARRRPGQAAIAFQLAADAMTHGRSDELRTWAEHARRTAERRRAGRCSPGARDARRARRALDGERRRRRRVARPRGRARPRRSTTRRSAPASACSCRSAARSCGSGATRDAAATLRAGARGLPPDAARAGSSSGCGSCARWRAGPAARPRRGAASRSRPRRRARGCSARRTRCCSSLCMRALVHHHRGEPLEAERAARECAELAGALEPSAITAHAACHARRRSHADRDPERASRELRAAAGPELGATDPSMSSWLRLRSCAPRSPPGGSTTPSAGPRPAASHAARLRLPASAVRASCAPRRGPARPRRRGRAPPRSRCDAAAAADRVRRRWTPPRRGCSPAARSPPPGDTERGQGRAPARRRRRRPRRRARGCATRPRASCAGSARRVSAASRRAAPRARRADRARARDRRARRAGPLEQAGRRHAVPQREDRRERAHRASTPSSASARAPSSRSGSGRSGDGEEGEQPLRRLLRAVLGQEVPGVERRAADVGRPRPPDLEHVAVEDRQRRRARPTAPGPGSRSGGPPRGRPRRARRPPTRPPGSPRTSPRRRPRRRTRAGRRP